MEFSFIINKLNVFSLKQVVNVHFHIKKMNRIYGRDNENSVVLMHTWKVWATSVAGKIPHCS